MESTASALSTDDAKLLLGHCRAGRLYEIEAWIASGKSLRTPREAGKTPLQAAIESGFQSLIELLIRHAPGADELRRGLAAAVSKRRVDLVRLLLARGADIHSVPLVDVLLTWEPQMIRLFLDEGADAITGAPFALAFGEKVRTALRPLVEYKKAHAEMAPALQEQADRALRHFCSEGDLKWISLLLWAGANPRTRGPTLEERWTDDPECHTTALLEACSKGSIELLAKLKPDRQTDNLSELLSSAAISNSSEIIHYLLSLGATPNDQANGGCSALDHCFWHLGFWTFRQLDDKRLSTKLDVSKTLDCIRELVEHGAIWKPQDRRALNSVRQALYKCEPAVTVDLVKLFARNKVCPEETLEQLLDAPRMRDHLSTLGMKLVGAREVGRRVPRGA